jgi:type I restriction enzyme R subunit
LHALEARAEFGERGIGHVGSGRQRRASQLRTDEFKPPHAKNLRYALIEEYNRRNNLPPNDAAAEKFIVAVHNEMSGAQELIEEFQKITGADERKAIVAQAHKDPNMALRPIILVGIGMLDTGIDAPDVEVLLMARPTKSKILYVQMKGRGTRKCKETGKDIYKLVDFVDIAHLEPLITNETAGVVDEPVEQEEEEIIDHERDGERGRTRRRFVWRPGFPASM